MLSVAEARGSTLARGAGAAPPPRWPGEPDVSVTGVWPPRALARRHLNLFVALVCLVAAAPLMALIAVAIKLSSPGPVLSRRVRVGLDRRSPFQEPVDWRRRVDYGGRLFTLYEFRTVRDGGRGGRAGSAAPATFAVGRLLERTGLAGLPQLINVVRGDMNVVGPRPEAPEALLSLRARNPRGPGRQRVLPGMTGLAQISGKGGAEAVELEAAGLACDFEYIRRESALEDVRIMLRAAARLVRRGPPGRESGG